VEYLWINQTFFSATMVFSICFHVIMLKYPLCLPSLEVAIANAYFLLGFCMYRYQVGGVGYFQVLIIKMNKF
jgi:hypothetical protein